MKPRISIRAQLWARRILRRKAKARRDVNRHVGGGQCYHVTIDSWCPSSTEMNGPSHLVLSPRARHAKRCSSSVVSFGKPIVQSRDSSLDCAGAGLEIQGLRELRSKKPANLALAVGVMLLLASRCRPNYELAQAFFPGRDPTAAAGSLTESRRKSLFLRTRASGVEDPKESFLTLAVGSWHYPQSHIATPTRSSRRRTSSRQDRG